MPTIAPEEVIVFLIAANIIVAGMAVFIFLTIKIQQKRKQIYQRQLLEKEIKVREESFQQISRDLHDEVGSSLSGINMLTQLAMSQIDESKQEDTHSLLLRINAYSNEVIEKVNDMAWLLKPGEESLLILLGKLKKFGTETASSKNIEFRFSESIQPKGWELNLLERKALYLISKEAINNAVKYSDCSQIDFSLIMHEKTLNLVVRDNGKGFQNSEDYYGNGLMNMKDRAKEIGANFELISALQKGTIVEVILNKQTG